MGMDDTIAGRLTDRAADQTKAAESESFQIQDE